jgi:3-hydroxyisobutyrate dehydrogenase-like beta-hydroxyacid dehydrogenase|tara:strand:+ start:1418 stop:2302 length:885 start_codon:yes stop_codon:yes gene_type:complete
MINKTIGILMPGDMGHGCGKAFIDNNFKVVSCLVGRSDRTRKLSHNAGIIDLKTIENVIKSADIILSILPPESALKQSKIVNDIILKVKKNITYVDCNATSPKTAKLIDKSISSEFCNFIDAGIIGLNPIVENGNTRLYVSGPNTKPVKVLHGKGFIIKDLGKEIGKASAMKMIYASATKGTFALHAAVLTAAHKLNLSSDYFEELEYSKPDILQAMQRMVPRIPLDAARWEGEMFEIAETFSDAGVTPKFHQGSAEIMSLANKTPIANETRETVDVNRTLIQALDMYVDALKK